MTKEAMIKVLRYKVEHIKTKIRPEFFAEVADMLEQQPCDDTISRADAIRVASGYCHPANIAKELAKLPPVTPQPKTGHWIPVSERLPELDEDGYSQYVLVSFSNFTLPCIGQLRKTDGENHWYEGDDEKALDSFGLHVNAWMPLPNHYEPQERNDKE